LIKIESLSKKFKMYPRQVDRLIEWLTLGHVQRHQEYWALKDVKLNIEPGQVYGILGMNGAGKSTLLKLLTGTLVPTTGLCVVDGRVSALLELGAGFHQELTGRENVLLNGRLHGLSQAETLAKVDEIKEFSELGHYFEQPVRTYSSGMYVRLGFAVASAVKPDVLIIDEALSVGDAHFQQKCINRINQFKREGITILFVSHDIGAIKAICDKAALLHKGQVVMEGAPSIVMETYNQLIAAFDAGKTDQLKLSSDPNEPKEFGTFAARVRSIEMIDSQGKAISALVSAEPVTVRLTVEFNQSLSNPTFGILIRNGFGSDIFGINTFGMGVTTGEFAAGEVIQVSFAMPLDLGPGEFTLSAAVHAAMNHTDGNYYWGDRLLNFKVVADGKTHFIGIARLHPKISIKKL
jgi:lipopolysaccharide transport system ATP-binding protein